MSFHRPKLKPYGHHLQSELTFGLPSSRWRVVLNTVIATLRLWRHRRAQRCELQKLDLRTLHDIGIAPGQVDYEMQQPFWRSLRDWRG